MEDYQIIPILKKTIKEKIAFVAKEEDSLKETIERFEEEEHDFIIESKEYKGKFVYLNVTSTYGDLGLFNFDQRISLKQIEKLTLKNK